MAPVTGVAQDKATRLETLIQDSLSNENQIVTVRGFDGLLSSNATLDLLTIADGDGVWLTLENAALEWSQSALLRGALQVDALTAANIVLDRLPNPAPTTADDVAATPITFPDLPVSVELNKIRAANITFGEPVFGEASSFALDGSLSLIDGGGAIELDLSRLDGPMGILDISSSFMAETGLLSIDFDAAEGQGGIVSTLLGIPDAPSLRLNIAGQGPIDDFSADLTLAGNNTAQVTGTFNTTSENGQRDLSADVMGDLTPFLTAEYHDFFGTSAVLGFDATLNADGATHVPDFTLRTSQMNVGGAIVIDADGQTDFFDIKGSIAADTGAVRLPIGTETHIERADILAQFDAATSDIWAFDATIHDVIQDGTMIEDISLTGTGQIGVDAGSGILVFETAGIDLGDDALSTAVGGAIAGSAGLAWGTEQPFSINDLRLSSGDIIATGNASIDTTGDAITYATATDLVVGDFDRFSALAGQPLSGNGTLHVDLSGNVLDRTIELQVVGDVDDVDVGIPALKDMLQGTTRAEVDIARDETGIILREFSVDNTRLSFATDGMITPNTATLQVGSKLVDLADLGLGMTGPATVGASAQWTKGERVHLTDLMVEGADITVDGSASIDPETPIPSLQTDVTFSVDRLSQFARLLGRPISGGISGALTIADETVAGTIATSSIAGVLGDYDRLVAGDGTLAIRASGRSPDDFVLSTFDLRLPRLSATVSGSSDAVSLDVTLSDLSDVVADLSGPATLTGGAARRNQAWQVDLDVNALNTAAINVSGTVDDALSALDLGVSGLAPLSVVNPFISPRSLSGVAELALRLTGAPALSSLNGTVTTSGARFSEPTTGRALTDIGALVSLAGGRATVDVNAQIDSGGTVAVDGPLTLSSPYEADFDIALRNVTLIDPTLYQTEIDGDLALTGGLLSRATVSGSIDLGPTEVRIPDTISSVDGAIPDGLTHIAEPASVRQTRSFAGLIATQSDTGNDTSSQIAMDVTVRAPNQIFLRGRGLDAEMGGEIRLTGTTDAVVPIGAFELIRGRLDFLTERLDLTEGEVRIEGSLDPYVLLMAEAEADDVTITVTTEGFLSDPEITFASSPELPQDEVLAQLIFNSAASELSALQAIQLASAIATLAGRGGLGIIGNLRESTGLDDLNVSTDEEGNATVEAGKYIAENVYTNVEIDSTGQSQVNLNIDITDSLLLKGSLGSDGESSIGAFVERDY